MNKQETWAFIKANEPSLAQLLLDIQKYMGRPEKVELK